MKTKRYILSIDRRKYQYKRFSGVIKAWRKIVGWNKMYRVSCIKGNLVGVCAIDNQFNVVDGTLADILILDLTR